VPVELIGWIAPRVSSELIPASGPPFDADVVAETARIHERAAFDRVLIGYFTDAPDGFLVGAQAASVTERLQFLLAHRPGFVAPPLAARKLATLDQLSGGRLAVHIISGGSDADQAKDGDWTDHAARYRRSAEYLSYCAAPGRRHRPSTIRASSIGPEGPIRRSAAGNSHISRFMAAAVRTPRSKRWRRMSMCTCCGANR
jgi:alkanesulfonate monooxygenase SsuD/methylene tetrahydromethanopterin reductase-like flavin-dependent oxidoreductase (luciferase family)